MQEEVTQKTIALVIKTAKLDANVLKAAMRMYLNHRRQKAQKTHGKTSVKKLVGEGVGVSSIEVMDGNIKSFERVARKYNVDFAVKKDKTTDPPKYVVFFKGRDADAVAQAFKESMFMELYIINPIQNIIQHIHYRYTFQFPESHYFYTGVVLLRTAFWYLSIFFYTAVLLHNL